MIQRYAAGIQYCYGNELKREPSMRGKLIVAITVAASGEVTDVAVVQNIRGTVGGGAVELTGTIPVASIALTFLVVIEQPTQLPASCEVEQVTRAEFGRFMSANPDVARLHEFPDNPGRMTQTLNTFSPEDSNPAIAVTWSCSPWWRGTLPAARTAATSAL